MRKQTARPNDEQGYELSDSELEQVAGGKEDTSPRDSGPASTMICSGNRGLSTHVEVSLEL